MTHEKNSIGENNGKNIPRRVCLTCVLNNVPGMVPINFPKCTAFKALFFDESTSLSIQPQIKLPRSEGVYGGAFPQRE